MGAHNRMAPCFSSTGLNILYCSRHTQRATYRIGLLLPLIFHPRALGFDRGDYADRGQGLHLYGASYLPHNRQNFAGNGPADK